MANQMKRLKHLKLSLCEFDGTAVNSIIDLFGQQLCSFILDETDYHPNMRGLIENNSSKLEHVNLHFNYSTGNGTLPTKLPNNLKSFSLDPLDGDLSIPVLNAAKDCKNLKLLHFDLHTFDTLTPNVIGAIGKIERTNICRDRPDLVHLNVFVRNAFQMPDSLNSLTLRTPSAVNASQFLPQLLFGQPNKSIQHLDIRSLVLPSSSNFIENLLGQFPNLKSLHCKMPATNAELTSFFSLVEKHLKKGRKITIYFHFYNQFGLHHGYYKYILPDDLPLITNADWRPEMREGECENLVLKKLIKEAIDGGNNPSFLDDWWKEINE